MFGVVSDLFIKWKPYAAGDTVCAKFPLKEWNKIAGDIYSDKEWEDFVLNYKHSVKCWVLQKNANNEQLAVIYIFNEDGYFWNGTEFVNLCKPTDVTELKGQVAELGTEMEQKVDAATVKTMIKEYTDSAIEVVEF